MGVQNVKVVLIIHRGSRGSGSPGGRNPSPQRLVGRRGLARLRCAARAKSAPKREIGAEICTYHGA